MNSASQIDFSWQPLSSTTYEDLNSNITVKFTWHNQYAGNVFLAGSWDNWQSKRIMKRTVGGFELVLKLQLPCVYQYKFIEDGKWLYDMTKPTKTEEDGIVNNEIRTETIFKKQKVTRHLRYSNLSSPGIQLREAYSYCA
mmetsp:Transcript_16959/g.18877  ORF Transcript_16959/g.18877 Transcript_16959/m.18877 type:complete len:140 (-) Transcript_16959:96-515(-)